MYDFVFWKEQNYDTTKRFSENLLVIERKKKLSN